MVQRRTVRPKTEKAVIEDEPVEEEVVPGESFENGVAVNGLELLDAMDDEGPSVEEIDANARRTRRRAIPDGEYVGRVNRYEVKTQTDFNTGEEEPVFLAYMTAHGAIGDNGVEDRYVGAFLPVLSCPLSNRRGSRGNRVDSLFWALADALITPERRRELQAEAGSKYGAQVRSVLEEMDEVIREGFAFVTVYKSTQRFTRRDGSPGERHRISRVSPLPEELEPLENVED